LSALTLTPASAARASAPPAYNSLQLTAPEGYAAGGFTAINDKGQVVASVYNSPHAYPAVWNADGSVRVFDSYNGLPSYAAAINNKGEVVGSAYNGNVAVLVVWNADGSVKRSLNSVYENYAMGIDDQGCVAGGARIGAGNTYRAVRWDEN
jgi:uncharacterized membrane protein